MRLNVYTKLDDEEPELKCRKELEYCPPAKMNWFERALNYFDLNERFRKASLKKT